MSLLMNNGMISESGSLLKEIIIAWEIYIIFLYRSCGSMMYLLRPVPFGSLVLIKIVNAAHLSAYF